MPKKTLTIQEIQSREVETKFGRKNKMLIRFAEKPDMLIEVWGANWNRNWCENVRVDIDDGQWSKREYQGKTYWSIKAPEGARGGVSWQEFEALKKRVETLEGALIKKEEVPIVEGDPLPDDEPPIDTYEPNGY